MLCLEKLTSQVLVYGWMGGRGKKGWEKPLKADLGGT